MMTRVFFFFCFLGWMPLAQAQIAGVSFNTSSLSINPASAAARPFGHFTTSYTYRAADSKVLEDRFSQNTPWKEKTEYHQTEASFSHVHRIFVLEAYVAYDTVKRTTKLDNGSDTSSNGNLSNSNSLSFVNNMANLAIKLNERVGIGVKYFAPPFEVKVDDTYNYGDGNTTRQILDYQGKFTGLGFGLLAEVKNNWFLGFHVTQIKEDVKGTSTYIDGNGDSTSSSDISMTFETKGVGFGFQEGSVRQNGKHFELGYSRMDSTFTGTNEPGEQAFVTAEMAKSGIAFGASVRLVKNGFVDNMRLVESFLEPPTSDAAFTPHYDFFLSLNSTRGHSFALYGSYWVSKGTKSFLGSQQPATTTSYSGGISYTYLF